MADTDETKPKRDSKPRDAKPCSCDPMLAHIPVDPLAAQDPNRRCTVCGGVRGG